MGDLSALAVGQRGHGVRWCGSGLASGQQECQRDGTTGTFAAGSQYTGRWGQDHAALDPGFGSSGACSTWKPGSQGL